MKKLIVKNGERTPKSSYKGVTPKFIAEGFEPTVQILQEGDKSRNGILTLSIVIWYGSDITEFQHFQANSGLPIAAILNRCIFDLEGFTDRDIVIEDIYFEALEYALNSLGSLEFFMRDNEVVVKFTFYSHYIYFVIDKESSELLFKKT